MRKKYGNYITERRLGQGSFGEVWEAKHQTTGQRVALKLEPRNTSVPQLFFEAKLYLMFQTAKSSNNVSIPCNNIPAVYGSGQTENTNYIAMDLLGKSLEDIMVQVPKFSEKTVFMLAGQMISCVEYVHKFHYIHRDIKPDNFVMGVGENANKVYIIDFGLSKKYIDANGKHIKNCTGKSLTGTARYASINALEGFEQSRRDDMESLLYVWVYCLKGRLPWMGLPNAGKRKYEAILNKKKTTKIDDLCAGLNSFFASYLREIRSLKFDQEPNYAKYRQMIYNAMIQHQIPFDYKYDWTKVTRIQRPQTAPRTLDPQRKMDMSKRLSTQVSPPSKEPSSKVTPTNIDSNPPKPVKSDQKPYIPKQADPIIKTSANKTINQNQNQKPQPQTNAHDQKPNPTSNKNQQQTQRTRQTIHHAAPATMQTYTPRNISTSNTQRGNKESIPKPPTKKARAPPTSRVPSTARRVDGLRQSVKDRPNPFSNTSTRPTVSYKAGALPKWMMAPLTSRR